MNELGQPLGHPVTAAEMAAQAAEHAARVAACTHEIDLRNVGYGFGELDYFCIHCEHHVCSVPLADLSDAERKRVGQLVGRMLAR